MQRTKQPIRIPDAVNCSVSKNFTQIPNELLRNPEISGKAKALLCILLSNKEGWTTYIQTLNKLMKEGEAAIRSAIDELEKFGYLMRIRYRCEKTKIWRGSFWVYSDMPYQWDMKEQLALLKSKNLECIIPENPDVKTTKDNKIKGKYNVIPNIKNLQKNRVPIPSTNGHITPDMFEKFWEVYPRKADKGKAKTAWLKLCMKYTKERPTWRDIKKAVLSQKKTERWQDKKFILHPSTWLHQNRWLDDPAEMIDYKTPNYQTPQSIYSELLQHPKWQKKRLEILNRDEFKCTVCKKGNSTLHIHHTRYENGKKPWEHENPSLVTLCRECHEKTHLPKIKK